MTRLPLEKPHVTMTQQDPSFFRGLIRRPVTLFVLFATMLVIGVISYRRIPIQMMPDGIQEPELSIYAINPGASAQENEEQIARVLEEQLRTLTGVEEIGSSSSEDQVRAWVQFQADTDMDLAKADLRDRLERARPLLPDTVDEVGIWSWSQSQMPVMFMALLHPGDSKRTDFLVETVIQRRLEGVDGIGNVELMGNLGDSVRILLDEDSVRAAQLDLGDLISRLSADNFAMPMGEVEDGGRRVLLRSDMRFRTKEEIEEYPVGRGLKIKDVGEVIDAKSVRNRLFRIDGRYSYYVALQRDNQANVVEACARLNFALDDLRADPRLKEFEFLVLFDQGEFIESSLGQLRTTALWGGGFALIVLLVFLRRVRLTLCVALSIPVSALMAIAWAYFGGGSFNILTMTGITLAIGMLVDNSVVVIENIARLRAQGLGSHEAAARGVREVGLAVTLATLTTVIVFLPLIFMTEHPVMRVMFGELGFPLCLSLMFSLFVALVFLPAVAARIVGPRRPAAELLARACGAVLAVPTFFVGRVVAVLRALAFAGLRALHFLNRVALAVLTPLRWPLALGIAGVVAWRVRDAMAAQSLAEPFPGFGLPKAGAGFAGAVTAAVAGLVALGIALQGFRWFQSRPAAGPARPARFVPENVDLLHGLVTSNTALLRWTLTHRLAACGLALTFWGSCAVPRSMMEMSSFGDDENNGRITFEIRLEDDFTLSEASDQFAEFEAWFGERQEELGFEHIGSRFDEKSGSISLYWENQQNQEDMDSLRKRLRDELPTRAGQRVLLRDDDENVDRNRNLVAFSLRGPRYEKLVELAEQAVPVLEAVPGLSSVTTGLEAAPEQVQVVFEPDLAERMGVTPEVAFNNISWALRGWQLPRFQEPGREVPLIMEYDSEEIAGLDTLREMRIFNGETAVPLATVANIEFTRGQTEIRRRNGQATITLSGRIDDPTRAAPVTRAGIAALQAMNLPRGYEIGEDDTAIFQQEEEMREIFKALIFSIVLVYLVMGILLESWSLPIVVLWTIPFAVTGALWTLFLTGTTMDSVGWIGVIILVGVVVNNGIVLIDRIHSLHQAGMERREAVLQGSANRVRPIVMTALTTVCGLLPMALAEPPSQGIDYRALATCVAGGLAISTFFTLWVIPLWYTIVLDLAAATSNSVRWAVAPLSGRGARKRGKGLSAPAEA